jgi:hypothetical protein
LAICTIEAGLVGTLFSIPGGIGPSNLPLFDLLMQAEIVAVALLAPGWVFGMMGFNIAIIVGILHSHALSPQLARLTAMNPNIIVQAIEIQIIVAIFAFILVRSADLAIKNLDRAEEIAALERKEIERQEEQLALKKQLEAGVEQLLETHVRAANGDFKVRAPLSKDNVLWKVSCSLNNLLSRLERYNQLEAEIIRTQEAIHLLAEQIRQAKDNGHSLQFQRTGTPVDEIMVALTTGNTTSPPQQLSPSKRTLLQQTSKHKIGSNGRTSG